jgi:hypothetical protein
MNAEYEAALAKCRALHPAKYLSDPEVMGNLELTKKLQAEWDLYFAAFRELEKQFPFTDTLSKKIEHSDTP